MAATRTTNEDFYETESPGQVLENRMDLEEEAFALVMILSSLLIPFVLGLGFAIWVCYREKKSRQETGQDTECNKRSFPYSGSKGDDPSSIEAVVI